ncbi:MAG: hypothetical protein KF799_11375 [Bdellovibrionales bacterium]|nr:hypothetical protein [Bdellovibrionales bacterium]
MIRGLLASSLLAIAALGATAAQAQVEIYCKLRSGGSALECQSTGKDKRVMTAEDITNFVDAGEVAAFITLKSKKGIERTYMLDPKAPQYKRLGEVKRNSSISEIAKAKTDLFNEIEKRVIETSDKLDAQASTAELVLWDPGLSYDKFHREQRTMVAELDGYRKNRDKVCTSTPAFEQVSKANSKLQQTLSNIVFAFQTPGTCMSSFKVFKDRDGSIDLRQLDGVSDQYRESCKK